MERILNHEEKKFSTTDSEGPMHTSFADEKYMGMTVYDKDGKESFISKSI